MPLNSTLVNTYVLLSSSNLTGKHYNNEYNRWTIHIYCAYLLFEKKPTYKSFTIVELWELLYLL